jgi:hypothetical protein
LYAAARELSARAMLATRFRILGETLRVRLVQEL